jgi:hypothetical protein
MTENTGCLYDFWKDKTGVDKGMRSAFICAEHITIIEESLVRSPESHGIYNDVLSILDKVGQASKRNKDITVYH